MFAKDYGICAVIVGIASALWAGLALWATAIPGAMTVPAVAVVIVGFWAMALVGATGTIMLGIAAISKYLHNPY